MKVYTVRYAAFLALLLSAPALFLTVPAKAGHPMKQPTGKVLLTISGKIDHLNADGKLKLDRAMLERLGVRVIRTSTSWTQGKTEFKGVPVKAVLEAAGATGEVAVLTALNDYSIEIPLSDFETYPVLLAMKMNGKNLTARDKGPIWIVYPRDDYEELATPAADFKWVWQLVRLEIK